MQPLFRAERRDDVEVLHPQPLAGSVWSSDQMRGMATSVALARAVERMAGDLGLHAFHPTRWTLDMCRPGLLVESTVIVTVRRQGRRACVIDAELVQSGTSVALARALFLRRGETPIGETWQPDRQFVLPPPDLRSQTADPTLYYSDLIGWTAAPAGHANAAAKMTWHLGLVAVEGETASAFVTLAGCADVTNMIGNWGTAGIEYVNADVTLAISRLPDLRGFGLATVERSVGHGVAVASAAVFDRAGRLGTTTVTALASGRAVDPRTHIARQDFTAACGCGRYPGCNSW